MVLIFQMRKQTWDEKTTCPEFALPPGAANPLVQGSVIAHLQQGCLCWVLGGCPPLPNPTKLCNTSPTEQPVATASRDLAAGNQGGSLPTPSPPAQHLTDRDPTHLSLRRDVASAGRASASLQAPTSVMLFWDKLQGCNRGRAQGQT